MYGPMKRVRLFACCGLLLGAIGVLTAVLVTREHGRAATPSIARTTPLDRAVTYCVENHVKGHWYHFDQQSQGLVKGPCPGDIP